MINKKIQLLFISFSLFFALTFLSCTNVQAAASTDSNPIITVSVFNATPFSDDIRWRYKSINGILYKRQYNYSTNQWIGKWIKA